MKTPEPKGDKKFAIALTLLKSPLSTEDKKHVISQVMTVYGYNENHALGRAMTQVMRDARYDRGDYAVLSIDVMPVEEAALQPEGTL